MTLVPDRIRWYEDMLVTTRHVEALTARLEGLIQALPGRQPFPWGVTHCDAALHDRVVAVRTLDAVMPDGSVVAIGEDQAQLELDLRAVLATRCPRRLLVHLATPLRDDESAAGPRFVLDAAAGIVGDDALPAERRRRRPVLIAGDVPSASQYASVPLLEVSTDQPALAITDFVPPLLQVEPHSPLGQRCGSLSERLRREVASLVNGGHEAQPPFAAEIRAQVNPVIAALPSFEVLLASGPHPFALYVELCRVAAAVAALRNRAAPPSFPAYQHHDARAAFDPVLRFALGQRDVSARETAVSFPFERDGRWFRLPPDRGWTEALAADSPRALIVAVQGIPDGAQAQQWGAHCVIAGRSAIQSQLARRVLGLGRRPVAPAGELPAAPDVHLFRLDPDPELARPGEDLLVLGDLPGPSPIALTLYVVNREGKGPDGSTS